MDTLSKLRVINEPCIRNLEYPKSIKPSINQSFYYSLRREGGGVSRREEREGCYLYKSLSQLISPHVNIIDPELQLISTKCDKLRFHVQCTHEICRKKINNADMYTQ